MTKIKFIEIDHEQKKEIYSLYYTLSILHKEKQIESKQEILQSAIKQRQEYTISIDFSLMYLCILQNLSFKTTLTKLKIKCIDD